MREREQFGGFIQAFHIQQQVDQAVDRQQRFRVLSPEFAGLRPKLQGPGVAFRDFVVAEESARGAPGLINLLGIESPGLTAAGEIAQRVAALLEPPARP